ncbi:MAG: quinolinate synthase NadA [Pirellulaceae bacterium]|nr:quinolinate synthase NadA [Pirellulaceae bacterium]
MATTVELGQYPFDRYPKVDPTELDRRCQKIRDELGQKLLILGHHYQKEEVIVHADLRGDSYELAKRAASSTDCKTIVFCGVHFMAETAYILANSPEKLAERRGQRVQVILPDMAAGCSMADMANIDQVEEAWEELNELGLAEEITPVTYINSAANLKAFCGRNGGIVCTSSNARKILDWAFARRKRVLFFPDQHLGRNTALTMGISAEQMPIWDPFANEYGGTDLETLQNSQVLLWKGHCSVHQVFTREHIDTFRKTIPDIKILVHPECCREVNDAADLSGSTGFILKTINEAPAGSKWAIGTELNMVNRLKQEHPEQEIHFLSPVVCFCATMNRIDLPHLTWSLENLAANRPVNLIEVDDETATEARTALCRMMEVTEKGTTDL